MSANRCAVQRTLTLSRDNERSVLCRQTLRDHNAFSVLLQLLRSPSLTIVSNACGTLWNLSSQDRTDQQALWELGAVAMLKNLIHSKHRMISMGSAAALKNLLSARPHLDLDFPASAFSSAASSLSNSLPSSGSIGLHMRKQRALEAFVDKVRKMFLGKFSWNFSAAENFTGIRGMSLIRWLWVTRSCVIIVLGILVFFKFKKWILTILFWCHKANIEKILWIWPFHKRPVNFKPMAISKVNLAALLLWKL